MSLREIIESWENGWLVSISEPHREGEEVWVDARFSQPTQTTPIPKHYVIVHFHMRDDVPVGYLIECERFEKPMAYPITDAILSLHRGIKEKTGQKAEAIGLHM